ncbi:hypothetical protein [Micromonospora siamensis]|uniref:Excreted virulence factor EspC, type VII ESX diderm n=1 Tax=Micromonospora siamensis TaxID=299152 RepID=A0A1C5JW60_9ACTN|nr:hypothetical protein [Micromonospora siamensis]SCG74479.1 hypothetical protein GA0074704_5046 [Micromonospora siamensis]
MTGFEVDPAAIRAAGTRLTAVAEQFDADLRLALARIEGAGQPWGSDDIGALIGETHEVVAGALADFFVRSGETLRRDAADLLAMADAYDSAEESVVGDLSAIDGRLAG